MKKYSLLLLAGLAFFVLTTGSARAAGFEHGIVITLDRSDYYLAGPADGPSGELDVPGHYWLRLGPQRIMGLHNNTGPFGEESWWSSDAGDGELLYVVDAIIDT